MERIDYFKIEVARKYQKIMTSDENLLRIISSKRVIELLDNELLLIEEDGNLCLMNRKGRLLGNYEDYHEGWIRTLDCLNKFDFVDKDGNYMSTKNHVTPPKYANGYDYAENFSEGLALIQENEFNSGASCFINKNNEVVLSFPDYFEDVQPFGEGLAFVQISDEQGFFINKDNEIKIELNCFSAEPFSNGLSLISLEDKGCYIDHNGKTVIEIPETRGIPYSFSDGLALIDKDTKNHEFIDTSGKTVLELKGCDYVEPFSDGLALFCKDGYCGFINTRGEEVISHLYYNRLESFYGGYAVGKSKERTIILDRNGKIIRPYLVEKSDVKEEVIKEVILSSTEYCHNLDRLNDIDNINKVYYCSAFKADHQIKIIEEEDLDIYKKKIESVENSLRQEELADMYHDLAKRVLRK